MRSALTMLVLIIGGGLLDVSAHAQQNKPDKIQLAGDPERILTEAQINRYRSYARERISAGDSRTAMATLYFLLNAKGLSDELLEEIDKELLTIVRKISNPKQSSPSSPARSAASSSLQDIPTVTFEQISSVAIEAKIEDSAPIVSRVTDQDSELLSRREVEIITVVNEARESKINETETAENQPSPLIENISSAEEAPTESVSKNEESTGAQPGSTQTPLVVPREVALPETSDFAASASESPGSLKEQLEGNLDTGTDVDTKSSGLAENSEFARSTEVAFELGFANEKFGNTFITDADSGSNDVSMDLTATLTHKFAPVLSGFLELSLPIGDTESSVGVEEFWFQLDVSNDLYVRDITLGTQSVFDARGWMFDSTLDLVKAGLSADDWGFTIAAGVETQSHFFQDLLDSTESVNFRWLAEYSRWIRGSQQLSLFVTGLRDTSADNDNIEAAITWVGGRATGSLWSNNDSQLEYWTDIGIVSGSESTFESVTDENEVTSLQLLSEIDVRGWAYDIGATWLTDFPGKPEFTLALAGTSADSDLTDETDRSFRQPGIHSNSATIGSATGISSYGLVLDPELSNLRISTVGVGFPIVSASYLAFMYHRYHQQAAATELRDTALDLSLGGQLKNVGEGLDIEFSYSESEVWSIALSLGIFKAGSATEQVNSSATYGLIEFDYGF